MKNLFLMMAFVALAVVPACENDGGLSPLGQKVVALGEIGLVYAASNGMVKPGDVVSITNGLAIISSPGSTKEKALLFAELGIEEAVKRGDLSPGDTVLIREAVAVIQEPVPLPQEVAAALAVTGS